MNILAMKSEKLKIRNYELATDDHTTYISTSGTVSSRYGEGENKPVWQALDKDLVAYFLTNNTSLDNWASYEFPSPTRIGKVRFHTYVLNTDLQPRTFIFEVSDNGVDWTTVYTEADFARLSAGVWTDDIVIDIPIRALHFRFHHTNNWGNTRTAYNELELYKY